MDSNAALISSEPSIPLWLAAAVVAVLGLRAFLEYLRRTAHQGPVRGWRDLLLAGVALQACVWSTAMLGISSQGLAYPIGYHPLALFGALLLGVACAVPVLFWMARRPGWVTLAAGSLLLGAIALGVQVGVVRALGVEPGIQWRPDLLAFALLLLVVGHGIGIRLVISVARGAKKDRGWRRSLAALLAAVPLIAAQELMLTAAALPQQSVSAYARYLPEIAVTLLTGAAMPVLFLVMVVDQHMQRRIRRASRRKRHRLSYPSDPGATTTRSAEVPPPTTR